MGVLEGDIYAAPDLKVSGQIFHDRFLTICNKLTTGLHLAY
jgi:hypothetical protein